jgi:thiol:disulfide interchange protein DsbC
MQINHSVHRVERVRARFVAGLAVLAITMVAEAAAPPAPPVKLDVGATIKQNIESRFPGSHVLDVQPTEIAGLYEVFMGDQIVYADATADRLLIGNLLDTQTKTNLTQAHFNERGKVDFKTLPVAQAIKVVKGNGSRTFAVFSDPDCPYCQQLEKSLLSVNDYTMYVYLYPIASLHPQAPMKAHAIWCAPDRAQAWREWMQDKKLPAANKACSGDPIDSLQKLGDTLHINSTPTLFFANGSRSAGALPAADLEKELAAAAKK